MLPASSRRSPSRRRNYTARAADDQQRGDFRAERQVAGDEDHRAIFADAAREGEREACYQRRQHGGQDDAGEGLPPPRPEAGGGFLDIAAEVGEDRLDGADDERQADERQRDDDAERSEGDLTGQQAPDPPGRRVERGQRDAGDRGRQRERQVDERRDDALAREVVPHEHPRDEQAEDRIDRRRQRRCAEAQAVGGERPARQRDGDEIVRSQPRGLDEDRRQRDQDDDAQIKDGEAERQAEAGNDRPRPPRDGRGGRGGQRFAASKIWSKMPPSAKCAACARVQPPKLRSIVNICSGLNCAAYFAAVAGSRGR